MSGEVLKPCPLCGSEPRRNGRGRVGGVLCTGPANDHRVQAYGATQAAADTAWNTRTPSDAARTAVVEECARVADIQSAIGLISLMFACLPLVTQRNMRDEKERVIRALASTPAGEDRP